MKRLILLVFWLITILPVFGQPTSGTRVTAPIVPNDLSDTYPTHISNLGKGGYHVTSNLLGRDAIPMGLRDTGMLCTVISEGRTFILFGGIANSDWREYTFVTDSINNLRVSQRLYVQALGGAYANTFPFQVVDSGGYNRLGVTSKGLLISGRQHNPTFNVDALAMIGAKNSVLGVDAFAIGKNAHADHDSTFSLGYNLTSPPAASLKIGWGDNYMLFDKDSLRFFGKYKLGGVPFPLSLDNGYFQLKNESGSTFFKYSKAGVLIGASSETYFSVNGSGINFNIPPKYDSDWGASYTSRTVPDWENVQKAIKDSLDALREKTENVENKATITLTASQVFNGTWVQIIPAQAAGKMAIIDKCYAFYKFGTTAYTSNELTLRISYNGGSTTIEPFTVGNSSLLNSTANRAASLYSQHTAFEPSSNAVYLQNATEMTAPSGDGTLTLTVYYSVIDIN